MSEETPSQDEAAESEVELEKQPSDTTEVASQDDVASDDVASDDVASDDVASDDVASDDVASDDVASDDVTDDDVTGDDVTSQGAAAAESVEEEVTGEPSGDPEDAPKAKPTPRVIPDGPLELIEEAVEEEEVTTSWYILKVQVNREKSICDALTRRVKVHGLERFFGDILVPTEDVREFNKSGKQRIVKRKLYPGYIVVDMAINDDTWFLVRETPGIGDFTGSGGKPTPLDAKEIERIMKSSKREEEDKQGTEIKTAIKFKAGDRVRVKEGYFQNFEGEVETIDESNGRITVMINIFGRPTPVELDHWHIEDV